MTTSTTAGAIIADAFRHCGLLAIGQTLHGDYVADGLRRFKLMVGGMNLSPQFAYTKLETTVSLPASTASRTIGPGQQFDVAVPWRIEQNSHARLSGLDYPLTPIGVDEYNSIQDKQLDGFVPKVVFLLDSLPTARVYFWPRAGQATNIHLWTLVPVAAVVDATATITLPDGAEEMLGYLLALRLAPAYEVTLRTDVRSQAANSVRVFKRTNLEVPQLDLQDIGASNDVAAQLFGV